MFEQNKNKKEKKSYHQIIKINKHDEI